MSETHSEQTAGGYYVPSAGWDVGDRVTLHGIPVRASIDGVEVIITSATPERDEHGSIVSFRYTTRPVTDAD